MSNLLLRFLKDELATTAVEYAVLLALILMVAITAIASFGTNSGGLWGGVQTEITNAMSSGS